MFRTSHKDFACLQNILESMEKIKQYSNEFENADQFYEHTKSFDAVMMNFIVIGEMAEKLSDKLIEETQYDIDWYRIRGFRNIIAHNYFGIDAEEVWQVIQNSIPELEKNIQKLTGI